MRFLLSCVMGSALCACGQSGDAADHPSSPDAGVDAASRGDGGLPALASDAFVWGYPLVVSQRTFQTLGGVIGVNNLLNQTALSDATTRVIVSPNQDTLYSVAVVDLRSEPMVLMVPDVTDRYWTYQFLDAWTNSFHYLGTRATAGKGGTFAITPPGFAGTLPAGVQPIASPTPLLFLLGRFLVKDAADLANVAALSRTLVPASTVTGGPAPTAPPPLGAPVGTAQDVGAEGASFFDELGDALAIDPPASDADRTALAAFSELGIGPGLHPQAKAKAASDAPLLQALASGATDGLSRLRAEWAGSSPPVNGWNVHLDIGTYTNDFLLRAAVAASAWGANVPAEAIYPVSVSDASGAAYSGAKKYVMHFDAGHLPLVDPTSGFWSLTLYGPDHFFVQNSIQRYAISPRTPGLALNADGSLDFYIQSDAPTGHEANWLPAPAGAFTLMLRLYLPQMPVLGGSYVYPPVTAN